MYFWDLCRQYGIYPLFQLSSRINLVPTVAHVLGRVVIHLIPWMNPFSEMPLSDVLDLLEILGNISSKPPANLRAETAETVTILL